MNDKNLTAHTPEELVAVREKLLNECLKKEQERKDNLDNLSTNFLAEFVPNLLDEFAKNVQSKDFTVMLNVYTSPHSVTCTLQADVDNSPVQTISNTNFNASAVRHAKGLYHTGQINLGSIEYTNSHDYTTEFGIHSFTKNYKDTKEMQKIEAAIKDDSETFISRFLIPSFFKRVEENSGLIEYVYMTFFFAPFGTIYTFSNNTSLREVLLGECYSNIVNYNKDVIKKAADICDKDYKNYISTNEHIHRDSFNSKTLEEMLDSISFTFHFPKEK